MLADVIGPRLFTQCEKLRWPLCHRRSAALACQVCPAGCQFGLSQARHRGFAKAPHLTPVVVTEATPGVVGQGVWSRR